VQHSNQFRPAEGGCGECVEGQRDHTCLAGAAMYDLGCACGFLAPARTGLPRQASRRQRALDLFGPNPLADRRGCHWADITIV